MPSSPSLVSEDKGNIILTSRFSKITNVIIVLEPLLAAS